jgi:hypothetical protein
MNKQGPLTLKAQCCFHPVSEQLNWQDGLSRALDHLLLRSFEKRTGNKVKQTT